MDDNKKANLEITLEDLNELKEKLRSLKENIDKKNCGGYHQNGSSK